MEWSAQAGGWLQLAPCQPFESEDLAEFVLVGKKALKAQRAKLEAIQAIEKGFAAKEAALSDTQDLAEVLLYAEARLGELIPPLKYAKEIGSPGRTYSLPEGVNKKQSHYAQAPAFFGMPGKRD